MSVTNEGFTTAVLGTKGLPRGPCKPSWVLPFGYRADLVLDYNTRIHEAGVSLDGLRDQALHAVRRRPWARGMNSASMKYYEELVKSTVADLLSALHQREGEIVDISRWMTFFG